MDVVARIRAFNAGREPERLRMKYALMRHDAGSFLRGTCHLFYDRLAELGSFKASPSAWICGDLHLENFGSFKGDNRLVYFDINDFDEAALAPLGWDLLRFMASLQVWCARANVTAVDTRALVASFIAVYASTVSLGKAYWVERDLAEGSVRDLLDALDARTRSAFLDRHTRLVDRRRVLLVDGRRALAASDSKRAMVSAFMADFAKAQPRPPFYKVLDVARRIAGTGSLGVERYVVLIEGKGSPDGNYLVDLKEALPSALAPHLRASQPRWHDEAERIVTLQRRTQAVSVAFLQPAFLGKRAFVLRGMQPAEDRLRWGLTGQSGSKLAKLVATLAGLAAWAHLRGSGRDGSAIADELVDFARRAKWRTRLIEASQACAQQVWRDAATYNAAFDDGAFSA